MSKYNNVNPGQYKVGGRERMGEPLGQERDKMKFSKNQGEARQTKRSAKRNQTLNRAGKSKRSGFNNAREVELGETVRSLPGLVSGDRNL